MNSNFLAYFILILAAAGVVVMIAYVFDPEAMVVERERHLREYRDVASVCEYDHEEFPAEVMTEVSEEYSVTYDAVPEAETLDLDIKNTLEESGVTFAGTFSLVEWDCGVQCRASLVVNTVTGEVISLGPVSRFGFSYRSDSALLIVDPEESSLENTDVEVVAPSYYEYRDGELHHLCTADTEEKELAEIKPGDTILTEDGTIETEYSSEELDLSFTYRVAPDGYILFDDHKTLAELREHESNTEQAYTIYQRGEYEEFFYARTDDVPGEGPPAFSIYTVKEGETFDLLGEEDPDKSALLSWVEESSISNYSIRVGETEIREVNGAEALYYRWDGLYPGESYVFRHNGRIMVFNGSFLQREGSKQEDFRAIVDSFRIIE